MALNDFSAPSLSEVTPITEPTTPTVSPGDPGDLTSSEVTTFGTNGNREDPDTSVYGNASSTAQAEQAGGNQAINQATVRNPITGDSI